MNNKEKIGFDLVDNKSDYSMTKEENMKMDKEKIKEVYGKDSESSNK